MTRDLQKRRELREIHRRSFRDLYRLLELPGDTVERGARVGAVSDLVGAWRHDIVSPESGPVLSRKSARIAAQPRWSPLIALRPGRCQTASGVKHAAIVS